MDIASPQPGDQLQPPPVGTWIDRNNLRPVAIGFCLIGVLLLAFAIGVTIFGSAADGSPAVSLALAPASRLAKGTETSPKPASQARMVSGHVVADLALIEDSLEGPLPKIAQDGRTPMAVYAEAAERNDRRPKIAIVLGGLGVSAATTELALKTLPPQVTLAFVPFAKNLQIAVDKARGAGHEVLLQVPMEPFDFPNSDPGPHALLAAASPEENIKRLNWAMSRFTGYVGFTNLQGTRFLGEAGAIEAVLAEAAKRGILFFDTGASVRSLSGMAARHANTTIALGTLGLDDVQNKVAIDTKLAQLEGQAKTDGSAIGIGSLFPITVNRIAQWAETAGARGFHIVPISALAAKPATLASAASR